VVFTTPLGRISGVDARTIGLSGACGASHANNVNIGSHNIQPTYPVWPLLVADTLGATMEQRAYIASLEAKLAATEQKLEAQSAALRASEASYSMLFHHSPDLVLTVDLHEVVRATNRTAQRRLEHLASPLEGIEFASLFAADCAEEVQAMFVATASSGSIDRRFELTDGRVVLLRAAPIPNAVPMLQVVLRDVTSRMRMQEELERSRRLVAVGHLAAGVAHEINNPLTVMQLRVDLLREQHDDPELREQLWVIRQHIQRVARIVGNLQTFATPRPVERHPIALRPLLASAIELANPTLEGIAVELQLSDDLQVFGSQGALEQVFVILLANAGAAMAGRGTVRIRAANHGDRVRITVRDDGPGIPLAMLEKLFTPFTSGMPHRGTGLGLAIAWSLIHEHGGTLSGANPRDGGAEFTVTLPVSPAAVQSAPMSTPDAPPDRRPDFRGDLLLLDDDAGVATVLADVSKSIGYRVVTVYDAQEALRLIRARPFAGLLADVHLPGMSGIELLDHLNTHHPDLAKRTVLMSGLFLDLGPDVRYLQKPFSRRRLDETLRELE
jgi:PAS domain S-box-containing protein